MDNLLATIQDVRKKFGAKMNDDECALLCNEVAWRHRATGWGLSRKTGGTRGHLPNGAEIAHDILHHQPSNTLVDILVGAGAQSSPTWNPVGPPQSADRTWVAPVDPATFGGAKPADPTPVTPPPSNDAKVMLDTLKAVAADIAMLKAEVKRGAEASVAVEQSLKRGIPLRIKSFIGKIVGTIGGE